jgi:hypothetical protein
MTYMYIDIQALRQVFGNTALVQIGHTWGISLSLLQYSRIQSDGGTFVILWPSIRSFIKIKHKGLLGKVSLIIAVGKRVSD